MPLAGVLVGAALIATPLALGRQALVHHQAERQALALQALAHGLGSLPGSLAVRLQALPACAGGMALQVLVQDGQGRSLAQWQQHQAPALAPAAFVALLALPDRAAQAQLQVEGVPLRLQVQTSVADLIDGLWQVTTASLASLAGVIALGLALARRAQGRLRRAAADQAAALLQRQQALFEAHALQLEQLRQQVHTDPLTGLPNRRHFVAMLDECLAAQGDPPQGGLLLLRVHDLQGMNQRIGHASTDRLLQALSQTLLSYPQRIERCAVGRLNGADFALLLPVAGLAVETAQTLLRMLRPSFARSDGLARVAIGAVELDRRISAQAAMALADEALADAEVSGGFAVAGGGGGPAMGQPSGEATWQRRIARALTQGRAKLGEFVVCSADGHRLMLDCPLRVQLTTGGPFEPAQRWLSLAVRSQLSAQVDEKALSLALDAIKRDGVARCINMSAQAVSSPEFVAAVTRRLETAPDAACRLWIDLPESLALERPMLVRELSRRWRPLGALLALEHAGEGLLRIHRLIDLGLDCVRIDGRFVNGIADPAAEDARRYLEGLVRLVQSVGLQATAEGVRSVDDLAVLWALGFDAATGPALQPVVTEVLDRPLPVVVDRELVEA